MAKMQRWRRGRSAGEDTTVIEADETFADAEPDAELPPAPEPDAPDDEPVDEPADEAADETDDPEVETDDPESETDEPEVEADEAEAELELEPQHPELPHVPEHTGLAGRLLGGRRPGDVLAVQLLQAAHAKQAITTALAMGVVAAVTGRPAREAGVVVLTVLVGQTMLGWHNDIVDRQRDQAHGLTGKPVAMGRLAVGTVWYAIAVGFLLVLPLSWTTGIRAGCLYLASIAIGMLGNVVLRTGFFSWWSWAASFALLPAYLSYGGWGGQAQGSPPEPAIVALAALLGIGVHFTRAVWGLVADHEDGWTYLPLKLGLKLGATRLLALSTVFTAGIAIALVVVGTQVGLSR